MTFLNATAQSMQEINQSYKISSVHFLHGCHKLKTRIVVDMRHIFYDNFNTCDTYRDTIPFTWSRLNMVLCKNIFEDGVRKTGSKQKPSLFNKIIAT